MIVSRITLAALCVLTLAVRPQPSAPAKIAFGSHRDGNWEIYTMDADGGRETRLTRRAAQERFPLWSPDGSKIAFGSQTPDGWDLWVMDADGANAKRLATDIVAKGLRQWSPDGT